TNTPNCSTGNSTNEVAARSGCREAGCTTWAWTQWWIDSSGNYTETDTCVYAGSATWSVASNPAAGSKDLIGVLAHEFGHALGLNHTPNTVMDSPTFNNGNTLARYPYGDDIAGIRSLYSTRNQTRYFRERTGASWGSEVSYGAGVQMHVNAAVGKTGSGDRVVVASLDPAGTAVHFGRASFPLGSSPSITNRFVTSSSWRPPGIAGSDLTNLWVAAWTGAMNTLGCNGITIARSTDVFDSVSLISLPGDCTVHDPVVAYMGNRDRFILLYVRRAWGANAAMNNRLMARTTSDGGLSWTSAQDLGEMSAEGADLKCSFWGVPVDLCRTRQHAVAEEPALECGRAWQCEPGQLVGELQPLAAPVRGRRAKHLDHARVVSRPPVDRHGFTEGQRARHCLHDDGLLEPGRRVLMGICQHLVPPRVACRMDRFHHRALLRAVRVPP
ncbi:MAG: Matrixin, partial [Pseudomonadota bacterium]